MKLECHKKLGPIIITPCEEPTKLPSLKAVNKEIVLNTDTISWIWREKSVLLLGTGKQFLTAKKALRNSKSRKKLNTKTNGNIKLKFLPKNFLTKKKERKKKKRKPY